MGAPLPKRLPERGQWANLFHWLNQLRDYVASLRPLPSDGTLLTYGPTGVKRRALSTIGTESSSSIGEVRQVRVKDFTTYPDHMRCVYWNAEDSTEGEEVYVARPAKLRGNLATQTIESIVFTYTYTAGWYQRTATASSISVTERQVILPRYTVNDIIYIAKVKASDPLGILDDAAIAVDPIVEWIDLNVDGRAWARSLSQS